jgi:hypothetical protein
MKVNSAQIRGRDRCQGRAGVCCCPTSTAGIRQAVREFEAIGADELILTAVQAVASSDRARAMTAERTRPAVASSSAGRPE